MVLLSILHPTSCTKCLADEGLTLLRSGTGLPMFSDIPSAQPKMMGEWMILLMEEILHHLGWLKPYK